MAQASAEPALPEQLDFTRLAAARLRAAQQLPYLAMALFALTPIADHSQPTFSVDERWRLRVNPAKLKEWTVPQVAGVLLHEVSHVIRDHAARARAAAVSDELPSTLWNIACDAEINDDLLADGIELPDHPVTPASIGLPADKVAEFYYSALESVPQVEMPHCGSGCDGQADEAQQLPITMPAGLSGVGALLLRRRIAEEITRLARSKPGQVAGGWLRWAHAVLHPQLDWRRILAAKVKSSTAAVIGLADYSYAKPPRRRVPRVVLPSLQRPIPRVAIIVDTSASISEENLISAWTEVHGCLRALGIRRDMLTVYAADAEVHRVTGPLTRRVELTGGGGTDMAGAIEEVASRRPRPDLVVVMTDGFTGWPARPAPEVIVVLLPSEAGVPVPPPWAHVVHVA